MWHTGLALISVPAVVEAVAYLSIEQAHRCLTL